MILGYTAEVVAVKVLAEWDECAEQKEGDVRAIEKFVVNCLAFGGDDNLLQEMDIMLLFWYNPQAVFAEE